MIQFRAFTLARAAKILFRQATLQIHPGWRVGLTGANGSGKSSLLGVFLGTLHGEEGALDWPADWRVAHVAQETPALDQRALDYLLDGDRELRSIEAELADLAEHPDAAAGARIGELHTRLADIDGYAAPARAAALLDGLGFAPGDGERPVASFSGGWRMRLNLARALMCRADLLLLDEPTNHLDLDAVIWLEQWLNSFAGTLILISHDREFLDATVSHIAHIEQQTLTLYRGNYSAFELQRAARLAQQQAMFERQQREIAHIESYITRFRAKATKARQAQSRIKALERIERISAAHVDRPFNFAFRSPAPVSDPMLSIEEGAAGYDGRTVLADIALVLRPGERIGLLGHNGAGKSTLIKLLAGKLHLSGGELVTARTLATGYFAQHQLDVLRPDESPLAHLLRLPQAPDEREARQYLGSFGFGSDAQGAGSVAGADAPCGAFSGGEKSRLALALLIWQAPSLLLLDEPTNHLDLEMRHALTLALQAYEGAMVLVSHDRSLLRATCDRFLLVDGGRVQPFDGDLDDYRDWLSASRAAQVQAVACPDASAARRERKANREAAAQARQQRLAERRPLVRERDRLEQDLAQWQENLAGLDQQLADPALYQSGDAARITRLGQEQGALQAQIEAAESRWLELAEALEALDETAD